MTRWPEAVSYLAKTYFFLAFSIHKYIHEHITVQALGLERKQMLIDFFSLLLHSYYHLVTEAVLIHVFGNISLSYNHFWLHALYKRSAETLTILAVSVSFPTAVFSQAA